MESAESSVGGSPSPADMRGRRVTGMPRAGYADGSNPAGAEQRVQRTGNLC